jgi:hypothetical protein
MVHFPYSGLLISYCTKQMGCTSDGLASNFLCTGCNVSLCTDYQLKSQTHIWFIHAFHQLRPWDPNKSWKLNWCQLDYTKSSQDSMIISDKRLFFCNFILVAFLLILNNFSSIIIDFFYYIFSYQNIHAPCLNSLLVIFWIFIFFLFFLNDFRLPGNNAKIILKFEKLAETFHLIIIFAKLLTLYPF